MKPFVNCALYLIIMQIIIQSIFKEHLFLLLLSVSFVPFIHPFHLGIVRLSMMCRPFCQMIKKMQASHGTAVSFICYFITDSVLVLPQEVICCVLLWFWTFFFFPPNRNSE